MDKKTARKIGLKNRSLLTDIQREKKNREIFIQVLDEIHDADRIGCYVSMRDEVSTVEILQYCFVMRVPVCVPKVEKDTLSFYEIESRNDLRPGIFGTEEPWRGKKTDLRDIDIMLVPLSSFDEKNNRTGYGKGYYDSILKFCDRKIGLAYNEQKVEEIETDTWDVPLDKIIHA